MSDKTLGQQNGFWLLTFKLLPIILTAILGLQVWQTRGLFGVQQQLAVMSEWRSTVDGDRFRREDGLALKAEIMSDVASIWRAIDALPKPEFRRVVVDLTTRVTNLEREVAVLESKE